MSDDLGPWMEGLAGANAPAALPDPGTVLGTYKLINVLRDGGMARIYTAEHTGLARRVALKMLAPQLAADPKMRQRFFSEARAVNRVEHEHLVSITDFVEDGGPYRYYIMELLKGETLRDRLAALRVLPMQRAVAIMAQVADALSAIHEAGIVHCDVKPDNIFLSERAGQRDFVKLLDFGIAKFEESGAAPISGEVLGTPAYMSPEQVANKNVDYRSDVYSFGVVLYELLTGKLPFAAASPDDLAVRQLSIAPPAPSKTPQLPQRVPETLDALTLQCLARDAEARPQSMQEVLLRLRMISHPTGVWTAMVSRLRNLAATRRKLVLGAAAAGAILLVTGVVLLSLGGSVTLQFESDPAGAEVVLAGSNTTLGTTPFSLSVERSDEKQLFEFRKAGHRPAWRKVTPDQDQRIDVTLSEIKARPERKAPPEPAPRGDPRLKKRGGSRGGR